MNEIFSLLQYSFFTNAIIAGLLTSIAAGIAGTYIVSRKTVFISGGITHASFGGIGLAYFLGLNPFIGAAFFAIISALGIEWSTQKAQIREDSAIAILWSLGMAIGIIFVFLTPGYSPNLMSFLFGNILTVTTADILSMLVISIVVTLGTILFYRLILYTAFDIDYIKTQGFNTSAIRYIISAILALTIVMSIRVAGIILVLSMFTIPQSIAGIFTNDFKKMIFISISFCFWGVLTGLVGSYFFNLPSGAIIIFTLILSWAIIKSAKYLFTTYQLKLLQRQDP
ncbi:metal ABC transporter permease [Plebeiibacterium marinum]|uniref:Metal ABC transporter permease n=1 Tax=Plebeiibacterium marinum TaxID=2992111 RepID=A0AAE3MBI5_9BACT|nr:metal ABC transporter permease [Plebeiobacterium marinum]MCW3804447.1 metal ABC transporter permease [Plebeiobacterium marinum]